MFKVLFIENETVSDKYYSIAGYEGSMLVPHVMASERSLPWIWTPNMGHN